MPQDRDPRARWLSRVALLLLAAASVVLLPSSAFGYPYDAGSHSAPAAGFGIISHERSDVSTHTYDYLSDFARPPPVESSPNTYNTTADSVDLVESLSRVRRELSNPEVRASAPRALPTSSLPNPSQAADLVRGATPVGSALKNDAFHRAATFAADDIAANGSVFRIISGDGVERTLIQAPGGLNGVSARFEWIVDDFGNLTHQTFIKGGSINGVPNVP